MFAEILKTPSRYDCLKRPSVLALENLDFTLFHLIALLLFVGAIIHTLSVHQIHRYARSLEATKAPKRLGRPGRSVAVQVLYFLSQVEIVFAVWVIPLFLVIANFYGWGTALEYVNTRDYTEALFVVIILCIASTKPIIQFAERLILWLAKGLGGTLSAWWFTLLTVGPLLGSFITEAGAMAISALLLSRQFYAHRPSKKLAYATIALLFVNVSVGGVLTHFASPAILILSHAWHWSNSYLMITFGWKAALGILLANCSYWYVFRKEFSRLNEWKKGMRRPDVSIEEEKPVPYWVTGVHLVFMALIVMSSLYPAIFIAAFLFFIGFYQSTRQHQCQLKLTHPLLVGLFIAGLVIHGGLQGWWVLKALADRSPAQVLGLTMSLTAFSDNAAISYLATLIPNWGKLFQYALLTGVIAGGGLTVIANAPNPAGYVILSKHFDGGISPWHLFKAALLPTFIMYAVFILLSPLLRF